MRDRRPWAAALLMAGAIGCGRDEILHGIDEGQANQAVVALSEAGISAATRRDDGSEGSWRVEVPRGESMAAQRLLSERGLPRKSQPGFGEIFGKGSIVPSPSEERALYLHALSGELARTIEAIDGVAEARVHLALASQDAARAEPAPLARAAVLVKASPGWRVRLLPLAPGIQSLVAGAVAGLDSAAVAVVIAESAGPGQVHAHLAGPDRRWLLASAVLLASLAVLVPAAFLSRSWLRLPLSRAARAWRGRPERAS